VAKVHPLASSNTITQTTLKCQIQVTQYLDLIFPYLKGVGILHLEDVLWLGIRGLEMPLVDVFWLLGIRDLVELCQDARRIK
jgi:hypothetical protein